MSQAALTSRAREIVASTLNVPAETIRADSDFVHDLGADSIGMVELTFAFEDAFDIELTDDEVERLRTFQDALTFLRERIQMLEAA